MECLINGVSFEGCNSNKNVIFVDSYKEVFFDILSLELNEQTIIAELIENTKTGPYVNIKKVILNGKAYQDIKFLVIKEKADTRIHLNETKLNESAAGIDYIQPKLTPAIRVNTPVVAPNSKPVDVSARQEIERIKEQALSNIRVEKEKLLLLKEEINSVNISIDDKVEEYRSEILKSFYDIADSNKNILEKKIDIALKDATSQLQEINSTNYINHVNDIVKKHVDDIAAQYSGKEKDLLESINDKVTVDISEIANVLEGKVNLAIKTIAEDNTVTIQDKNNQILEHVNKEITNATESLNITLENYKTHLLDNYLQTLKNSSDEFKKSTNVTLNEAVTDLQEKNQTAFNLQSNNSITKSVNDLTKIIESSKLEFGQEMRTSLREVTDDVSTKILNSFNLEKIKIDEKIEHLNAEAVDIFNNLKHNTKVSLESKIEAIDSNINSLNDTKNKFIDEVTILIEQFKTKTLQSIEAEKLIIDEKIKKLDTISKNTEDTISKLSEQVTANKEKLVDEVDTYLHEVAIANKNTVAEKIEELQKKINESLLEVNIETVYSKFIDVYGNKVDVAITEFIDSKKRLIKEELNDIGVPQPTQDFDTLIKSHWEQKEPEMMQKVKKIAATYADSYGGGGSVAVQYAKGGTMDGNLNITGMILSGGQDLSSIFSSGGGGGGNPAVDTLVTTTSADWNTSYTNLVGNSGAYLSAVDLSNIAAVSANWNTSYTFLTSNSALILGDLTNIADTSATWDNAWTNLIYNSGAYLSAVDLSNIASVSANWNNTYTQFNSNSALYATTSYVNSNFLSLSGGTLSGTLTLYKDLSVLGNLFVTGSATFGNTIITTSSALSVVNTGPGPALYISQGPGGGDIASFYDSTNNLEVLHIGNDTPWINNKGIIGIRTSNPNETLTVIGGISATGIISTSATNSNSNNWTSSFTYANANSAKLTSSTSNYLSLSGGTLTGGLSGTTGTFSGTLGVTGVATLGNGAILGTPASGTVTNLTGTASININGTVGATTPSTGAFTTLAASGLSTLSSGVAVRGNTAPTSGAGLELVYDGTQSVIQSYNRTSPAYQPLWLEAGTLVRVGLGGSQMAAFTSTGLSVTGALAASGNISTTSGDVLIRGAAGGQITQNSGAGGLYIANSGTSTTMRLLVTNGAAASVTALTLAADSGNATFAGTLVATGVTFTADDSATFGPGGASNGHAIINLNSGSASGGGGGFRFRKNGTNKWFVGDESWVNGNSSDGFGFWLGSGTQVISLSAGGNVGIGTTSPSGRLHVAVADGSTNALYLERTGASATQFYVTFANAYSNLFSSGVMTFSTGGSERMRIDSSGNVGLGATTVAGVDSRLRVVGGSDGNSGISMGCSATDRPTLGFRVADNSQRAKIELNDANGSGGDRLGLFAFSSGVLSEVMSLRGGGQVGIGTTSPAYTLDVVNPSSSGTIRAKSTTGGVAILVLDAPATTAGYIDFNAAGVNKGEIFYYFPTNYMSFNTNAAERMRIDSSGNLILKDRAQRLDFLNSDCSIERPAGQDTVFVTTASGFLVATGSYAVPTTRFSVTAGVAKLEPAYTNTTASGANVVVESDGTLKRSTSSLKYKRDIREYTRGIDDVMKLRPVFYKGKAAGDGDKEFAGFIAEEVAEVKLEEFVVRADDDTPDALAYSNMVALLTKAIQQLNARLAALEAK